VPTRIEFVTLSTGTWTLIFSSGVAGDHPAAPSHAAALAHALPPPRGPLRLLLQLAHFSPTCGWTSFSTSVTCSATSPAGPSSPPASPPMCCSSPGRDLHRRIDTEAGRTQLAEVAPARLSERNRLRDSLLVEGQGRHARAGDLRGDPGGPAGLSAIPLGKTGTGTSTSKSAG